MAILREQAALARVRRQELAGEPISTIDDDLVDDEEEARDQSSRPVPTPKPVPALKAASLEIQTPASPGIGPRNLGLGFGMLSAVSFWAILRRFARGLRLRHKAFKLPRDEYDFLMRKAERAATVVLHKRG